jgi:hypothetical protein
MIGNRENGGPNAQPEALPEEIVLAVRELAGALTALGNFVAAATLLFNDGKTSSDKLREALAGASSQHERAGAAHHVFKILISGAAEQTK